MKNVYIVEAIADAIMHYEGWNARSRSYLNRNPGNLRATNPAQAVDAEGYRIFDDFVDGYIALTVDLVDKFTGRNAHKLNADSTLLALFAVYAPAGDYNRPVAYAAYVATWLRQVYGDVPIYGTSTIAEIYKLAEGAVPDGFTSTGHPATIPVTVPEVPADRVASGPEPAITNLPADTPDLGGNPGSGPDLKRLSDDRPEAAAGTGEPVGLS